MDPQQIEMIVASTSAAMSAVFDFAFSPNVIVVWGPIFVLYLAINLIRVALGKGYAPGADQLETLGEKYAKAEMSSMIDRSRRP